MIDVLSATTQKLSATTFVECSTNRCSIGPYDNIGGHLQLQEVITVDILRTAFVANLNNVVWKDLSQGKPAGTAVCGHDAAELGPYRMSWLYAEDVPTVVSAVFAAGAQRPRLAAPSLCALGSS